MMHVDMICCIDCMHVQIDVHQQVDAYRHVYAMHRALCIVHCIQQSCIHMVDHLYVNESEPRVYSMLRMHANIAHNDVDVDWR